MFNDIIDSIRTMSLLLSTLIRTRYKKYTKPIYGTGKYKNSSLVFYYKSHLYQFFIQDRTNYYLLYLLRDNNVIKKDMIRYNENIDVFNKKLKKFIVLI